MNTKRLILSVAIALGGFAAFIPGMASAEPYDHHHGHGHEVCHYDHHHHRSCHWVH